MKVVRVKAKVAPRIYTQKDMDNITAELASCRAQILDLKQKNAMLVDELNTEKRNHALMTAGMEMWQKAAMDAKAELKAYQYKH